MTQKGLKVAEMEMSIQQASELSKQLEEGGIILSDNTTFHGFKR